MTGNKAKKRTKTKRGRPRKSHGGYAFLIRGELPEGRQYVRQYLTDVREGLISDLGPTESALTAAQRVLIDRVICKLGIVRCIEEHIKDRQVMAGENLAPSLRASYLAYNNSVRLDLMALGLDKRIEDALMPYEIVAEDKKEK